MGRPRKEPPAPLTGSEKLPEPVKTAPEDTPVKPEATTGQAISFKNTDEIIHHVAKLMPAIERRNVSFKKGEKIIEEVEHSHIWHNVTSQGRKQKHCIPMRGHLHEVTWKEEKGHITFTCGPPLEEKVRRTSGGEETYLAPKVLLKLTDADGNVIENDTDKHTHTIRYNKSEKITVRKRA